MSRKYEEYVGVKLPGKGRTITKMLISVMDSEEDILRRITTKVGTVFRLSGIDYEVICSEPFELKKLTSEAPFRRRGEEDDDEIVEDVPTPEPPKAEPQVEVPEPAAEQAGPDESGEYRIEVSAAEVEPVPESTRRAVQAPVVGECWKPKDPRRKASFTVVAIDGDHAVTDDGRRIQLARFKRYERVPA